MRVNGVNSTSAGCVRAVEPVECSIQIDSGDSDLVAVVAGRCNRCNGPQWTVETK
jgi:hypothetical protein